jgi:hypothetical protein
MADRKISDLTALTAPAAGDYLPIVDISEASAANKNKRITIEELLRGAPDGTAAAPSIGFESDPNTGIYRPGADQLAISTGGTEHVRIDSSGRLLVGTSSALTGSSSEYSKLAVQGNSANAFGGYFSIGYGGAATGLSAGSDIGTINFTDTGAGQFAQIRCDTDATTSAGDFPGRLVFSTTADGASSPTERMRITSGGSVQCASATGSTPVLSVDNSSNVSGSQVLYLANRANANDTSSYYIIAQEPGVANRFFVYGNGNVANTNNSYGAISDVKLKENIIDASSQWNDLKALRVRNYNFKPETGQQTHTQIGLVAQEVEVVSPGLIYESPDLDAEGNDLGTVTKSVNYSVLYMKAVKALQEAMQRIETLEAKVAALEGA